jgi:uncharacterized protein DUF5335
MGSGAAGKARVERIQHRTGGTIVTPENLKGELETKRVPNDQLKTYFDKFTRHFLLRDSTNAVDVEVLAPDWGDQFAAEGAHLFGITYDPKDNALEFEIEGGDHRVTRPKEVWTAEEFDGFVKAIEIVRDDGTREVARVNRLGVTPASSATTEQPRRPK